jgi:hypothetical protein
MPFDQPAAPGSGSGFSTSLPPEYPPAPFIASNKSETGPESSVHKMTNLLSDIDFSGAPVSATTSPATFDPNPFPATDSVPMVDGAKPAVSTAPPSAGDSDFDSFLESLNK